MIRVAWILTIGVSISILSAISAFAAFEDLGTGARPLGMGGAFVATADDASAIRYNAAGLGHIEQPALSFTQSRPFAGLVIENYLAGLLPVANIGTLGLSFSQLTEVNEVYKEQVFLLSFARRWSPKVATGFSFKRLGTSLDEGNDSVRSNPYLADSTSASAFSFDFGALLRLTEGLQVGAAFGNLLPADIGLQEEENVPVQARVGLAYDFAGIAASAQQPALREILAATRVALQASFIDGGRGIHAGAESWLSDSMAVRIGYANRSSVHSGAQLTAGASLKFLGRFQFDYAFQWFTEDLADNTGHRISTSIVF